MVDESSISGKYTRYGKKIGLDLSGKDHHVVLNFPYKDCVLEGGMSKEEKSRSERFLNNGIELDGKYIKDALFSSKVLTNFDYICTGNQQPTTNNQQPTTNNQQPTSKLEELTFFDEEGELKENLLIKGNNLLALHALRPRLAGKVKLIYIDPPYNTGSDGFKYNDNFNHSSWLVFMKNRLEVARELLRDDGVIFVQCDDNEQAYLKVLMDEIFGRENCINTLVVPMSNLSGPKIEHAIQGRLFPKIKEYLLSYSKSNNYKLSIPKLSKARWDNEYNTVIKDFSFEDFQKMENMIDNKRLDDVNNLLNNKNLISLTEYFKSISLEKDGEEQWKQENSFRIVASKPNEALRKKAFEVDNQQQIMGINNNRGDIKIIRTDFNRESRTARIELAFARNNLSSFVGDIWQAFITTGGAAQEGGVSFVKGKKPESLIKQIIETATQPGDIVLDYHLGSGTTAAVAHKMGRRWIGIEQMDYIEDIAKTRLQKVIEGEQGGISKQVNWQGGGSFCYFELKKYNQEYREKIEASSTLSELKTIFEEMKKNAFLEFWFDEKDFKEEHEYGRLDLWERKELLLSLLDENMMYLPLRDMNDEKYQISEEDKSLTKKFYGEAR